MELQRTVIAGHKLRGEELPALDGALNLYSRFLLGQFSELGYYFAMQSIGKYSKEDIDKIRFHFDEAHKVVHGDTGLTLPLWNRKVNPCAFTVMILHALLEDRLEDIPKLRAERIRRNALPHGSGQWLL